MKRMHLHIAVTDLETSIGFYSTLFGAQPTVTKSDYAKWMLEDPKVNFAISNRSAKVGLDHIGIQVESDIELTEIKARLDTAELAMATQEGTNCCYAKSNKHWVQDPAGIAWETYHTLESTPTFNDKETNDNSEEANTACCSPSVQPIQLLSKSESCC
jgi:predicted enzyme related to lactoylglutathione lyase